MKKIIAIVCLLVLYVGGAWGAQTFQGDITGNAATVTTNANLTGQVTSVGNDTSIHYLGIAVHSDSSDSTTPDVTGKTVIAMQNSGPITVTNFTGAVNGQIIILYFGANQVTINRDNSYLSGGANFVSTQYDVIVLLKTSIGWLEISRSANS